MSIFIRTTRAVFGLILFSFGIYLSMQAQLGISPWEVFTEGISRKFSISYGTASVIVSICVVGVDLRLGEKIGLGTILDALLVGPFTDVFLSFTWIPTPTYVIEGLFYLLIGILVMSYAQYLHISSAICCGPRDALLVAVAKRFPCLPVGIVNSIILITVLVLGWFMGGHVGIGTLIIAVGTGLGIQFISHVKGFDVKTVVHLTFSDLFFGKKY